MKKTFFFIFLLVCALHSKAQTIPDSMYVPFPKDSAQWSVATYTSSSWNTIQYKLIGDTIVNGTTYGKIYTSQTLYYGSPDRTLRCLLREDSTRKVWVKYVAQSGVKDTNEFVLYDFNAKVGDTLTLRLLSETQDTLVKFLVNTIDKDPTFTQEPNYIFSFSNAGGNWVWSDACDNTFGWNTGGMGSNYGLLFNEFAYYSCFNGVRKQLSCYWKIMHTT